MVDKIFMTNRFTVIKGVSQIIASPDNRKGSLTHRYMPLIFRGVASGSLGVDNCKRILNLLGASRKAFDVMRAAVNGPPAISHLHGEGIL